MRISDLRIKYRFRLYFNLLLAKLKLVRTLMVRKCYYGPFKGEFGHILAHNAPFLMYLHKKGVKITYCGLQLHAPILVDENGKSIIHDFRPLRDFFAEVTPDMNESVPPPDVQQEIIKFEKEAKASGYPFWNIGDKFYYWDIHREFLTYGHTYLYNIRKVYRTGGPAKAVALFPRSKGAAYSVNNGGPWDYELLIDSIKSFVEKIYVVGHPSQSFEIRPQEKVELCITADNAVILEKCANSEVIITPHSGAVYLSEYFKNEILLIYNGEGPIGNVWNTLRFKKSLGAEKEMAIARTYDQVTSFIKNKFNEKA